MAARQQLALHSTVVESDVDSVYRLIENVSAWPAIFGPTIHVRLLERTGDRERLRIWASVNGKVISWISARTLDRANRCIGFEQENPIAPLSAMGGRWEFRPLAHGRTEVALHHHFSLAADKAESVDWVRRALEDNSTAELAALTAAAGTGHPIEDVLFSFQHKVTCHGSLTDAYEFVNHAEHWPARLPHVAQVRITEDEPGIQQLAMVTRVPGGGAHQTESVRVCLPDELIAYKQSVLPAPLSGHSGLWRFGREGDELVIESAHTVLLDPARVPSALGSGTTIADARAFVQSALENNSRITLLHTKEFAERASLAPGHRA